ncbi:MAG: iron-containing redox enzyme family protein [Pseudomonadota bacterium]
MHPLSPDVDPDTFHQDLAHFNAARVAVGKPSADWQSDLQQDLNWRLNEGHYLEHLRKQVAPMLDGLDAHTGDTGHFVAWFETLALTGPGQQHRFFDWLAGQATLADMRWFLTQEAAGEAGFDDLVAYAQVKLPARAKLECARNYWDEMGHGKESAMHGHMLDRVVQDLALKPSIETTVWESLALSNTMLGLAMNRRYAYHALGALGAIELTAPGRVAKVSAGMKRLGLPHRTRAYFDLHAALDVSHAKAWIREIIGPLVDADPECARFIAEGALMRMVCGQRCFERYTAELRVTTRDALPRHAAEEAFC